MKKLLIIIPLSLVLLVGVIYFFLKNPNLNTTIIPSLNKSKTSQSLSPTPTGSSEVGSQKNEPTLNPIRQIALSITSPANNSHVTTSKITIKGITAPNSEVFVNDVDTRSDSVGNFSVTMTLDEDENIITLVAIDSDGNSSEEEITVYYDVSG